MWSGKRDSNPRHSAWKADALPAELFPRSPVLLPVVLQVFVSWWRGVDSNHRRRKPADLQSAPFGRSGTPPVSFTYRDAPPSPRWSWRWDSNPRPAAYKAAALPTELRQPKPVPSSGRSRSNKILQAVQMTAPDPWRGACSRRGAWCQGARIASGFAGGPALQAAGQRPFAARL